MDKKTHFAGLDGLRFISISFVVLHHLFTFRNYFSSYHFDVPVIGRIGYYGIQFFFAGSGFLITYLLLKEIRKNGKVSIGHFYLRRILRIWPAYYVLIIISLLLVLTQPFFQIPQITEAYLAADYHRANLLFFSFLPHFAGTMYPTAPFIHQTYTIGIEEQFYFLWGIIFLLISRVAKKLFWIMLIGIMLLSMMEAAMSSSQHTDWKWLPSMIDYIRYFRFSTFAIGALWAYAFFVNDKWANIFKSVAVQLMVYGILIACLAFDIKVPFFNDEFIAVLTLCLFSVTTHTHESLVNYEASWLRFLGKISYGIYLFHIYAIVLSIKIVQAILGDDRSIGGLLFLCVLTLAMATLFGWISYFTVEKFFLRIKSRLTKV